MRLARTLFLILLCVGLAAGQWVEDSISIGGNTISSMVYSGSADVIYGASEQPGFFFTLNCSTSTLLSRIFINDPLYVAYSSISNKAYCTVDNTQFDTLLVVDGTNHERIKTIPLNGARYLTWDSISDRVYVSCHYDSLVIALDCRTDSIVASIRVGEYPLQVHLSSRLRKLYVFNSEDETVSILDLETHQVVGTISVPGFACGLYSAAVDKYYCGGFRSLLVVDGVGDTVVARIPHSGLARALTSNEQRSLMFLAMSEGIADAPDSLLVIDATQDTVMSRLAVGSSAHALHWSPQSDLVYCTSVRMNGAVWVVAGDGSSVLKVLSVGDYPAVFAQAPRHRRVYLSHWNGTYVYVIRDEPGGVNETGGSAAARDPLLQAAPNPFRQKVTVSFGGLPEAEQVAVYSQDGRLVRGLKTIRADRSGCWFEWDGRDRFGREVPAGVYTVVMCGAAGRMSVVKSE